MKGEGVQYLQFSRFENQPKLVDQFIKDPLNAKLRPIVEKHRKNLAINIHKCDLEGDLYLVMIRGKFDGKSHHAPTLRNSISL